MSIPMSIFGVLVVNSCRSANVKRRVKVNNEVASAKSSQENVHCKWMAQIDGSRRTIIACHVLDYRSENA